MKTDKQLQEDVMRELAWESSINSAHIGVEVDQGVVTLLGHVDTFAEKWGAERAVKRVSGVHTVAVELDVKLKGAAKRTDSDIALSVSHSLAYLSTIPKDAIRAMVEQGTITLSGEVEWDYQRHAAENTVRNLMGVRGVINLISVKPKVNVSVVKSEIEAALKRRAYLDAQEISVSVEGDALTLSGKIHSWTEKNLAINSAWSTPGVRKVVDKLMFV